MALGKAQWQSIEDGDTRAYIRITIFYRDIFSKVQGVITTASFGSVRDRKGQSRLSFVPWTKDCCFGILRITELKSRDGTISPGLKWTRFDQQIQLPVIRLVGFA
jgi:hypothetical protein